tara:strand:+ start:3328 stop:3756 length:429 start_codon:yes stop_codon:yes gene_type:complete
MSNQDTDFYAATSFIKKDEDQNFYLSAQQCNACNAIFLDNRISCSKCFELNNFSTIRLSDTGSLYSYSIVHRSFPGIEVPYISAIVDLDDGGTIKGNLINVDPNPKNISFDMKVKLVFQDALGRKDKDGNSYVSYFFEPLTT